jgi:hypothetical protein
MKISLKDTITLSQQGQLLSGYGYHDEEECRGDTTYRAPPIYGARWKHVIEANYI